MPHERGAPKRKLPQREDALKIDLPFDEALKAALEAKPEPKEPARPRKKRKRG